MMPAIVASSLASGASEAALLGHVMSAGAVGLVLIGLYAMLVERDLVRIILGLALVGSGINLLIVAIGYRPDAVAPILVGAMTATPMVDPIPQALVLTSIVIDVGVLALALALAIRVYESFGTVDTRDVQRQIAQADDTVTGDAGTTSLDRPRIGLDGVGDASRRKQLEDVS